MYSHKTVKFAVFSLEIFPLYSIPIHMVNIDVPAGVGTPPLNTLILNLSKMSLYQCRWHAFDYTLHHHYIMVIAMVSMLVCVCVCACVTLVTVNITTKVGFVLLFFIGEK